MRRGVSLLLSIVLLAAFVSASSAAPPPRVTVLGDSVLTGVLWNAGPLDALKKGFDMHLDIGVCRTVAGVSCPYEGGRVPTLVDAVRALGSDLAPVVLVEVGYNDSAERFPADLEYAITLLLQTGAKRILWVNLHGWSAQIDAINGALLAASRLHRELTIVDWQHYASNHWSWFQGDSIHLLDDGAMAMALYLNDAVASAIFPLVIASQRLPTGHVGKAYGVRLQAHGGTAPYRWKVSRRLPTGLSLRADGRLVGKPTHRGRLDIAVQVTDAKGRTATRREVLSVVAGR